jgi:hypothetical protein
MLRVPLAIALALVTVSVSAASGRPGYTPLSVELHEGNRWAIMLFLLLGAQLVHFSVHCWRVGWKALSVTVGLFVPLLVGIACTPPTAPVHISLFAVFLIGGVAWMLAYAEADCQRLISALTGLLVFAFLALLFILGISSAFVDATSISPVGLFQKGFLLIISLLALRQPNLVAEQAASCNPPGAS